MLLESSLPIPHPQEGLEKKSTHQKQTKQQGHISVPSLRLESLIKGLLTLRSHTDRIAFPFPLKIQMVQSIQKYNYT